MDGRSPITLRPHDVCVAIQLVLAPDFHFRELGRDVGLSLGESHNSVRRLEIARLYLPHRRLVNQAALRDLLLVGVPYVWTGQLASETRGAPTARAGPILASSFPHDEAIVWPSPDGPSRGAALAPMCKAAPSYPVQNPELYGWLTIVDALRVGRARERRMAHEFLSARLGSAAAE